MTIRLSRFFAVAVLGLVGLVGGLFWLVLASSQRAIVHTAEHLRLAASRKVSRLIEGHLAVADESVGRVERLIRSGLLRLDDPASLETQLYAEVLGHPELTEVTLTTGEFLGYAEADRPEAGVDAGDVLLAPAGRRQTSVLRVGAGGGERLVTRRVRAEAGRFLVETREGPPGRAAGEARWEIVAGAAGEDPASHPTFVTPANRKFGGRALWSDLAFAEADAALPAAQRRKVVTVQKALVDAQGRFLGVVRTGLESDSIDRLGQTRVDEDDPGDQHRVFITDEHGRLITRLAPTDPYTTLDEDGHPAPHGDVRAVPPALDPALAAALANPVLAEVTPEEPATAQLSVGGEPWLVSYTALPAGRTQGWVIGILVPQAYYLRGLIATRNRLLGGSAILLLGILVGGGLALRAVRSGLGRVVEQTKRMRNFDFAPAGDRRGSGFTDVNEALSSLEVAKTALRAMGKYVPIDLLRLLYETHREPELGGELTDVSIMFSDIRNFTTVSEQLAPNQLATALGCYFATMTREVHRAGGTLDKYIGDSLMVMWNAPTPCPDHPQRACEAALSCVAATRELFASPQWEGRPAWHTRFGLHRDTVTVGHFGAPDRISYTSIGDGVNLASRLEGLNKLYGTSILASETIQSAAADRFVFRRLDRVAVKGKTRGVVIYELLGRRGEVDDAAGAVARYEAGLDAYFARRFADGLALLEAAPDDEPARRLAARCRELIAAPPPPEWDGVYVAREK